MRVVTTLFLILGASAAVGETARYDIRYQGGRTLQVTARLPAGDGRLLIAQEGGIDHLPHQWATFVQNILVT